MEQHEDAEELKWLAQQTPSIPTKNIGDVAAKIKQISILFF